jgi:ABC-type nitrate/sulfonate/bicarbonate transport system substrate-binding protein
MTQSRWLSSAAAACLALAALAPTAAVAQTELPDLPDPEKDSVVIGLSVTEISQFAVKLAEMAGYFEKHGITPEIIVFEGDGRTLQALQANQLDAGFIGVSAAINSQVTDAPVTILSTNATILSDNFVAVPEVTNAEELRGKCVAVSTFGGTSHGSALLALQALGLTAQDVTIQEIGGQDARVAALEGGACQAAPVDVNLEQQMLDQGFNILVNLKEERLPWGRSGMAVTEEYLAANPNTALAILAATLEGQNTIWADPEAAARYYAEFSGFTPEEAASIVADFQEIGNRSMIWTDGAFETPKATLATVNPDIANVPVSDAYDRGPIQTLIDIGYYEALGIPLEEAPGASPAAVASPAAASPAAAASPGAPASPAAAASPAA